MQDIQHCLAYVFADPAIPNHFLNNSFMGKPTKRSLRVPNIYKPATHESQNKKKGNADFFERKLFFE